jgi:hypothetical protein
MIAAIVVAFVVGLAAGAFGIMRAQRAILRMEKDALYGADYTQEEHY